ncbi:MULTISPECIES: diguanylate cyclase [unclassified Paenibacillus]|uniref:diguanylate cyclase n=1 Tax=unclassified Paenibacillus TaxID=185978 RepID=UPI001AE4938E|nr:MULTISPECIES: diguanylate cyclase [unclassified Paenibacillus]MBP1154511.1 diguanylate cyclase [Paenibacillus sp. PvP091]MBP1170105.1 diguanylate cyclase [Paenibacillus sp. PvR098]MBP2441133.1 diguanylate cyclase [Paenibacillus sp. PvP052]
MKLLSDLFINLCVLGMLLFTFNLLTRNRKGFMSPAANRNRKLQFGVCMGIIGLVLMQYTIYFKGTILDLRQIPVIIAAIYGGGLPSIVASMVIAVGRIVFFGVNKASILAASLIIVVGYSCGVLSKFKWGLGKKWLMMSVSNLILTSIVFYLLIDDKKVLLNVYVGYWSISLFGGFIIHYLTEYLRQSKELFQNAQENAVKDFLTGLNNVRKFDEVMKETLDKADHYHQKVSLILIDIDHFKLINDRHGHLSGDEVLKQLSKVLMDSCSSMDIVSRNGGEEFSVILPSNSRNQAVEIAERIRATIEGYEFRLWNGSTINITVSLGVSTYRETTFNQESLIKQADDCLYQAKRTGRNKVASANLTKVRVLDIVPSS